MTKIRVGINGFGRVGRCTARILLNDDRFDLVAINDIGPDTENLAYLLTYDSTYGRHPVKADVDDNGQIRIGDKRLRVHCQTQIEKVDWDQDGVDIVIDSSGVNHNVLAAHDLVKHQKVKKVIITHSPPPEKIDNTIIMGINDDSYKPHDHHVVSSSICDANAIAHVFLKLEKELGIESGFVTSLHPWLSYQNLVDAPTKGQANPQHFWKDYSLGRSSVGSLIPKNTTAVSALLKVLPQFEGRLDAISYRIPTHVVTSADISLQTSKPTNTEEVRELLKSLSQTSPYVGLNQESLISVDYEQTSDSVVIDDQWTRVLNDRFVKIVVWYDNEWGYSSRVADLAHHITKPFLE